MDEKEFLMAMRDQGPEVIRTLAEIARSANKANRKKVITELVARRFLTTSSPSDDDLDRIEKMTDDEINAVLQGASH